MARIKIKDLPKDAKISGNELRAIQGGRLRSPTGIIIESGSSLEHLLVRQGYGCNPGLGMADVGRALRHPVACGGKQV